MSQELWREERLLVNGVLRGATGGATFDNVNPATEQVVGRVADATAADVDEAIAAARTAFDTTTWSTDHAFRSHCLRQLAAAMTKHAEEFKATLIAEIGCPQMLTNIAQYDTPVEAITWIADLLDGYQWETDLGSAEFMGIPSTRYLRREATGVVAAITPWNYPVQINIAKSVPALAAGNTVVLKAAPDSPYAATLLGRLVAEETDIPAGVFNVIVGTDHQLGAQLTADPRVDMISFTGSTATGRAIMRSAADNVTKVFLELGGKSAAIMLDDADVATAAAGVAFQVTSHAGQGCAITSRWLVPRSRYDEAVSTLTQMLAGWPYGDPTDPGMLMGPLINERQRDKVLGYIDKGVAEGARVAIGGKKPGHLPVGWFVEPTVLVDVKPDDTVAQEEIFGPVLVVIPHDGDDDAVAIANNSAYGLSGAVISADLERAKSVATRIRTGTIGINGGMFYAPDIPFGGYKHSGIGRESGVLGFEEYLEVKSIAVGG